MLLLAMLLLVISVALRVHDVDGGNISILGDSWAPWACFAAANVLLACYPKLYSRIRIFAAMMVCVAVLCIALV